MKIGIVCYPSVGGSGVVATELGIQLAQRGHEIHFISYDVPHRLDPEMKGFVFHHVDVPYYPLFRFPPYTLALASQIFTLALENKLELLHAHYAIPHATSAVLAGSMLQARTGRTLPVVTTLHGTDTDLVGQMPEYKPVVEFSLQCCDAITAVSHYLKNTTEKQFNLGGHAIDVIYNFIDTQTFAPLPEKVSRPNGECTIIHVSNLRPVKRIQDAVKVFDLIRSAIPARLLFVGEGPDRSLAEPLIDRLGLADHVEFVGKTMQVAQLIAASDLLLSTSESESFGLTIAEAMACQVPVVATQVGGVPEVVRHGIDGLLAPLGDIQGMAEAAISILCCSRRRQTMGQAGRKRVLEMFNIHSITDQYEQVYERVLAKRHNCVVR